MPNPEDPITFPQYVMQTMFQPGENKQHLVETVLRNIWVRGDHAHVFLIEFQDSSGTFEGVWIAMPEAEWDEFLRSQEAEIDQAINSTIEALEREANKDVNDEQ
jgi:hypothetical protein